VKRWYVLHTQTGSEDKVKKALESRVASSEMQEFFSQIIIPTEQISEIRSGKRKISQRKFFPGYILIEMDLNEKAWLLVKTAPGVTGFIGSGRKPAALTADEVDNILKRTQDAEAKPTPKVSFEIGEPVRVTDGPFVNFNGVIEGIHSDKQKIDVSVLIFGRSTPVELEYWQVEKI